jgi:hypothetical protein
VTAAPAAASSDIKTGAPSRCALDAARVSDARSDDVSTATGADAKSASLMRTDVIAALFSAITDVGADGVRVTAAAGAGELGGGADGGGADDVGPGTEGDGWMCGPGWLVHAATESATRASAVVTRTRPRRGAVTTQSTTRTQ